MGARACASLVMAGGEAWADVLPKVLLANGPGVAAVLVVVVVVVVVLGGAVVVAAALKPDVVNGLRQVERERGRAGRVVSEDGCREGRRWVVSWKGEKAELGGGRYGGDD